MAFSNELSGLSSSSRLLQLVQIASCFHALISQIVRHFDSELRKKKIEFNQLDIAFER